MYHLIKKRPAEIVWLGVIIVTPLVLFWRWLFQGKVIFWGTPLLQFWPWHSLVKAALLQGEWPLWNPLLGNGAPLLANLQSAVFYPPNLIYLFMPVEHALTLSVILHLILAGLAMFALARRLHLDPFPATVAALAYMLSGYIIGRVQFITMVNAIAWIPLALLWGEKLATRRRFNDVLGLAMILALQFLAGHAQLWFYTLCLGAVYTLFRSWQSAAGETPSAIPVTFASRLIYLGWRGWYFGLAVGLSGLLAAVQILPTAEFVTQSPRSSGAEREFALTYSFWPWRLITLLAPDFFGSQAAGTYWGYGNYWEDHAYTGVLPFLLALVAVGYYLKRKLFPRSPSVARVIPANLPWAIVPFFTLLIPISLILAMGWNTPVYLWVFETIPGFSFFQGPARLLIWYTLAIALLAGIGAQYFISTPQNRPNWRRLLAACVAITLAGLLGAAFLPGGRALTFLTAIRQAGIWLIVAIGLLLLRPEQEPLEETAAKSEANAGTSAWLRREPSWRWAALLVVMIDLLLVAWPLLPALPAAVFRQPIASAEWLKTQPEPARFLVDETFAYRIMFDEFFTFEDFGPVEPGRWLALKETLIPNLGVYAGLASANNNDPLVVGHWQALVEQLETASLAEKARLLAMMHVGYFIGDASTVDWPIVYQAQHAAIQQLPTPLPRAYFVPQAIYAKDQASAVTQLKAPDFDPRRQVVLLQPPGVDPLAALPQNDTAPAANLVPAQVIRESFNEVELRVETPAAGLVVLTDTYYPGWEVILDGQPAPLWQANLAFRAVAVEAGSHQLYFRYRPLSFTFGLWTSFLTWLIIGGINLWFKRDP